MNKFKIGCNFDFELIDRIKDLNNKYSSKSKIVEFYGSDRAHSFLAARPDFRLTDISLEKFEEYVKKSNENNIGFNYTMNSINPGSKTELDSKKEYIKEFVKYLEDIGVSRITVSNPLILELIRETSKTIPIEISTIAMVDTISQAKYYKDNYNIDKICGSLIKNRNFTFLRGLVKWCNENNISVDLMVNEFCGVSNKGYATHCPYRTSCYICHSSDTTKESAELFNCYPMNRCIGSRNIDNSCWLKMRFIRPEDLHHYRNIGITNFKITGRTGSTEYILKVVEAYCNEKWDGNLLSLWKNLDTIYSGNSEDKTDNTTFIDNSKLDGFLDYWIKNDWRCEEHDCGTTGSEFSCNYCNEFFKNILEK